MSDDPADQNEDTASRERQTTVSDSPSVDAERATDLLRWVGVAVLAITAIVALAGFYTATSSIIRVWVADPYQPVVNAAFNLGLLLAALAAIVVLVARSRTSGPDADSEATTEAD